MAKSRATPTGKAKDKEILERMRRRFARAYDGDKKNRDAQLENTEFVYVPGKQWTEDERNFRKEAKDPCMEFPQLKQFVAQVVNDQRQSRPGIRIHPADTAATKEIAELYQGVARGIEVDSRAESVYDCGYQHSVVGGRGYWRVVSEYESPTSFNQKLLIKRIADPASVVLDPDFDEPDGGDRDFGFVFEDMDIESEFKLRWPKASVSDIDLDADDMVRWRSDGRIRVADYYERVCEPAEVVMLKDGTTVFEDRIPEGAEVALDEEGKEIRRPSERYRVDWYTVAGGNQILDRHEWPGSIIPIICAMGDEIVIKGEKLYQGLIDQAKDTQRLFNFGMTQQAISLALTPRSPYVGPAESFAGWEPLWQKANSSNLPFLPYNAFTKDKTPLPAPTRQMGSTPDAGWLNWTQQMQMLLKSIIGMYENTLGMRGQETSGRAITAREKQGDTATFHFLDNFSRAIALTGRIIVECIPTYYATERSVPHVGPDDKATMKTINERQLGPDGQWYTSKDSDLKRGQYAVTVEAGPTYATRKQEAAELTMQLVQSYPPLMQWAGDIVVGLQEIPDVDLIVERMKLSLPPPVQQMLSAKEAGQNPEVAAANAQLQQMAQQLQQMQAAMAQLQQQNQQLKDDKSANIEASKAKVAQAQAGIEREETKGMVEQMKAMNERMQIQMEAAARRDETMAEILKTIITAQAQPQQVVVGQQAATQAMEANP